MYYLIFYCTHNILFVLQENCTFNGMFSTPLLPKKVSCVSWMDIACSSKLNLQLLFRHDTLASKYSLLYTNFKYVPNNDKLFVLPIKTFIIKSIQKFYYFTLNINVKSIHLCYDY